MTFKVKEGIRVNGKGFVNDTLDVTSNTLELTGAVESTSTDTGTLLVDGGAGITGSLYVGGEFSVGTGFTVDGINGDLIINGNLTVNGTTTTVNSTELTVDDINIILGATASPTDASANLGGVTLKGTTDKTLVWLDATDSWTSSENLDLANTKTYKIATNDVLSADTLFPAQTTVSVVPAGSSILIGADNSGTLDLRNTTVDVNYNLTVGGTTGLTGNLSVNTDKFSVIAASGNTSIAGTLNVDSTITGSVLVSDVANGTAPLTVTSTTLVTNLNADLLDGFQASVDNSSDTVVVRDATGDISFANAILHGSTSGTTILQPHSTASGILTLPNATDTLVGKSTTDTLTNKTLDLTNNTLSGTLAEFNTALSDANFVSIAGVETLTNKTLTDPTINAGNGTIVLPNAASPAQTADGSVVWDNDNDLLTIGTGTGRKTIVDLDSTQTLTNKTLSNPTFTGVSQDYELTGDVTGSVTVTNLGNVTIATTIAANSVVLGTDTTGNYVATIAGTANQVIVTGSGSETAAVTLSLPQDIATTSSPTFSGLTSHSIRIASTGANEIDTATGNLILDSEGGTVEIDDNLTIAGNLTVNGTTTTVNSTTISVDDKNIELGSVDTPTDTTASGGGITLKGTTDKTITWTTATSAWTSSEDLNVENGKVYKVNGTEVLSDTTLGSGVVTSSLTTVGTIGTGIWQGTIIDPTYGGTGVNNGSNTITLGGNLTTSGAFSTTLTVTGNTTVTLPTAGTLATTGNLSQFATTTSAQLKGIISDETGSGALVFANSPVLTTPTVAVINGSTLADGTLTLRGTSNTNKSTASVLIDDNVTSTSSTTGTLVVTGGVGISENLNVAGTIKLDSTGGIDLNNNNIVGVNNLKFADPGPSEGLEWAGGNVWKIYESPDDLTTNGAGNLQIVQNTIRRATFKTNGRLELPVADGVAPLEITSTTLVDNLNADLLDGQQGTYYLDWTNVTNKPDPVLTIDGDASGIATFTDLGSATLTLTIADDSHNHTTANIDNFQEEVEDIVGAMVSTNTESGIAVTYDDTNGKLNFDVSDFTITLTGEVTGTGTVTDLGNVSFVTTIAADSVELGTDTTGNYVASVATGTGLTGGAAGSEGATLTVSLSHLGLESLTDPDADRLLIWDDSAGATAWGTIGTGLGIVGTTISNTDRGSLQNIFKTFTVSNTNTGHTWTSEGSANAETNSDTLTIVDGAGIDVSVSPTTDAILFQHSDTSTQESVDNSNGNVIQDITLDGFGHITSIGSINLDGRYYTETESDNRFVNLTGDTLTGFLTLHADPTQALHAVTKQYVDGVAQGLQALPAAKGATTSNLTATYDNGTSGVGATLTSTSNGAFPIIDGVSYSLGDNVLVKDQTNASENGSYILTTVGDATNPWILTRSFFCDEPGEVTSAFEFVSEGTTYGGTGWVINAQTPITIGITELTWIQFSGAGTYTAGSGISLDGSQFSHANTSSVSNLSSDNSGSTFIQDISFTFDEFGHVTAASVATANALTSQANDFGTISVTDTDSGYTWAGAGSAVADSVSDTLTVVSGGAVNVDIDATNDAIRIAHADTSTVSNLSSDNSGSTFIQDINFEFDTYGHVTAASVSTANALTSQANDFGTISVTDTDSGYTWTATGDAVADATSDTLTVVSGSGINVDVDASNDAIRVTNTDLGSSQNIFKNIGVPGQTTIIADNNNDTLTLAAGTNITITTDAANDSITISSTISEISDLSDVAVTSPANGQILKYNGSTWVNVDDDSSGVGINWSKQTANYTASNGDHLLIDTSGGSFTVTLPSSPAVGDFVVLADAADWATNNLLIDRNGSTIEGISDNITVDIGSISLNLVYDGSTWQIYTSGTAGGGGGDASYPDQTGNSGKFLTTDGTNVSWADVPNEIPSQSTNAGKFLTTNGTILSWADTYPAQSTNAGKFLTTDGTNVSWADTYPAQSTNAGKFLTTDGTNVSWADVPDEIPSQSTNGGKFLTTDGTILSWADTYPAQSTNAGKFLTTDGTNVSWADVPDEIPSQSTNGGKFLTTDGTTLSWADAAVAIADDTTTDSDAYYPTLATVTSGNLTSIEVSSTKLYYNPSSGQLNATNFNSLSDINKKKNIKTIDDALKKVSNLRGVTFNWKDTEAKSLGVIAQEVEKIIPEVVSTANNGEKSVAYGSIIGLLIEAIKDLEKEITVLKEKL